MSISIDNQHFKLVVVGDRGVGKTTFIHRRKTGEFSSDHLPTSGVEVTTLDFHTNYGKAIFDIHECGADQLGQLPSRRHFEEADMAMVMVEAGKSLKSIDGHIANLLATNPDLPIVIVKNKSDKFRSVGRHICGNYYSYDVSSKCHYQLDRPFVDLLKHVIGMNDLKVVDASAHDVPVVSGN